MACYYAGVPFSLATEEWASWISTFHSLSDIPVLEGAGYDGGNALSDWPLPPEPVARPIVLGELDWPIGASRPAVFHGLMTNTQLDRVREEVDATGPYQPLVMTDGSSERWIIAVGMRMAPPRPLHQIAGREQLFLVQLWDQRALWYWRTGSVGESDTAFVETGLTAGTAGTAELVSGGNFIHNPETPDDDLGLTEAELTTWETIGGYDFFAGAGTLEAEIVNPTAADPLEPLPPGVPGTEQGELATTSYTTWADLYEAVAKLLGISIYVDPVHADYGNPTTRWRFDNRPLPTVLDAIATACGQKIVVRLDGRVFAINWQTAQVASRVQSYFTRKTAGGTFDIEDIQRWVPYSVTVVQGIVGDTTGTIDEIQQSQYPLASLSVPGYDDAYGLEHTTVTLHRDYPTAANSTHRQRVAYDWYGWQLSVVDLTLPGIWNWIPTGAEDRILWTYQNGPLLTRVLRGVWLELPTGWVQIEEAGGSGSDPTFLAQITAKCYYDGSGSRDTDGITPLGTGELNCYADTECLTRSIKYSWREVRPIEDDDCPQDYEYVPDGRRGSPQCNPLYHLRNLDIPVYPEPSPLGLFAGDAVDDPAAGDVAWENPGNAEGVDNDTYTTATLADSQTTHYLSLSEFCFGLGGAAEITNIEVRVRGHADGADVTDTAVYLALNGVVMSDNKTSGTALNVDTDTVISFSHDLSASGWNWTTLTPLELNDPGFGVLIRYVNGSALERTAFVDSVEVRVTFTPAGSTIPRLSVVRVWRGSDGQYYFDVHPWTDFVRRTGLSNETGEFVYHRYIDQNTGSPKDGISGRLIQMG